MQQRPVLRQLHAGWLRATAYLFHTLLFFVFVIQHLCNQLKSQLVRAVPPLPPGTRWPCNRAFGRRASMPALG